MHFITISISIWYISAIQTEDPSKLATDWFVIDADDVYGPPVDITGEQKFNDVTSHQDISKIQPTI